MSYRWNQRQAAQAFDAAATVIHPRYTQVQEAVLRALPFGKTEGLRLLDLGGGSGRLAERLLTSYPLASVVVLDQSEAFLDLAQQRLEPFNDRSQTVCCALQAIDSKELGRFDAVVSTSAIHHLEREEKQRLFEVATTLLTPGGVFINGDEHRPIETAEYLRLLEWWGQHMESALAAGQIPDTFAEIVDRWKERNLERFYEPRVSGEDCHETIAEQMQLLCNAGFAQTEVTWQQELWAVTVAKLAT